MTLSTTRNRIIAVADGVETVYPYDFLVLDEAHLEVYVNGVLISSGDYTVQDVDEPAGGTVTFTTAPANTLSVVLRRLVPLTQLTDYTAYGPFPAESHEAALDLLAMTAQQVTDSVNRALTVPITSSLTSLEIEAVEVGKLLQFNGNGDGVIAVDIGTILQTNYEGVLSGLAEGDLLHYDAATGTFINAPPEAGGGSGDILIPIDLVEFSDNSLVSALNFQDTEAKRVLDTCIFGSGEIGLHFPTPLTAYDLVIAVGVSDADTSGTKNFSAQGYTYDANGTHSTLNAAVVKTSEVLPDAITTGALITWSNFIGASDISTANTRFKFGITLTAGTSNDHVGDLVLRWIALRLAA